MTITDEADPSAKVTLGQDAFHEVAVIGGTLPNKTLLFDNVGPTLRHRILEGGLVVRGTELSIGYTDWRAHTLVDASTIDRRIGSQMSYGRFGPIEMPIWGDVEYEVSYGVAIDDVRQAEQALTPNASSRLLPLGRTAFETSLAIPAGAKSLKMYFHVKAFLVVDYSKYPNATWKRYADGERILVRERWDNENGVVHDDYDFATERR